jgi:hypothetical protein
MEKLTTEEADLLLQLLAKYLVTASLDDTYRVVGYALFDRVPNPHMNESKIDHYIIPNIRAV